MNTLDLTPGDVIEIGKYTLRFEEGTAAEAEAEAMLAGAGPAAVVPGAGPAQDKETVALNPDELAEVRATMAAVKKAHLELRTPDGQSFQPVSRETPLEHDDFLEIAGTRFRFQSEMK